jgi:hypothetical protein
MPDQRAAIRTSAATLAATAGAVFVGVGVAEAGQTHHMLTNAWFIAGLLLVVLGLAVGLVHLIPLLRPSRQRAFADTTAREIGEVMRTHSSIQAGKLLAPYRNQWLKVEGELSDVHKWHFLRHFVMVTLEFTGNQPMLYLFFNNRRVVRQRLSVLKRGTHIVVVGRIRKITSGIDLDRCELESVGNA